MASDHVLHSAGIVLSVCIYLQSERYQTPLDTVAKNDKFGCSTGYVPLDDESSCAILDGEYIQEGLDSLWIMVFAPPPPQPTVTTTSNNRRDANRVKVMANNKSFLRKHQL